MKLKRGESIETSLKKFKTKFKKTKVAEQLRDRQAFEKPSVRKRNVKKNAMYVQNIKDQQID